MDQYFNNKKIHIFTFVSSPIIDQYFNQNSNSSIDITYQLKLSQNSKSFGLHLKNPYDSCKFGTDPSFGLNREGYFHTHLSVGGEILFRKKQKERQKIRQSRSSKTNMGAQVLS